MQNSKTDPDLVEWNEVVADDRNKILLALRHGCALSVQNQNRLLDHVRCQLGG